MPKDDIAYCKGKNCLLKETCRRYTEGCHLPESDWMWMESCSQEEREAYWPNR